MDKRNEKESMNEIKIRSSAALTQVIGVFLFGFYLCIF